ncbi:MAG: hypothetical protein IJO06_08720 [Thermoguttaceae bacterium]|nr:hypothetical protein [Thermoguttaceae bacterium]
MPIKELQEMYGGSCAAQTINRAVIAEVPGGERALALRREVFLNRGSSAKMARVYAALDELCEEMRDFIAKKYNLKSASKEKKAND